MDARPSCARFCVITNALTIYLSPNRFCLVLVPAGILSHQLHRDTIDGEKVIIQNPTENQKKETPTHTFEMYDVYAIDVIVSTGAGDEGRAVDQ